MAPLSLLIRKNRIKMSSGTALDTHFTLVHGRSLEIIGAPGTGKTQLALNYARSVLDCGGTVAWITDRAFPLARLEGPTDKLQLYILTLAELVKMQPLDVDLAILEHYEYLLGDDMESWKCECETITAALERWPGAVIATSTPIKVDAELRKFGDGLGFKSCWIWHSATGIEGRIGTHHFALADNLPQTLDLSSDPPESAWGLEYTHKRRRMVIPGSPTEVRSATQVVRDDL